MIDNEINSALSGCYVHNIPMVYVTKVYDDINVGTDDYYTKERLVLGKKSNDYMLMLLTEFKRHVKNNTVPS